MNDENGRAIRFDRRGLLRGVVSVAALGAVSRLVPWSPLTQAHAQQQPVANTVAGLPANPAVGTRLVLLGTRGGPAVDLSRGQTASAVVVDGVPYLVDCGYGTLRALVASGVGFARIGTVFFSHLHDDHTSDLPALLSAQWTGSREEPTNVHGPYGTRALVAAAVEFLRPNAEIRMIDEGRTRAPAELFHGHDIVSATEPKEVFKDELVTVTAVENTHFPERSTARMLHRSLAYRFDTADRSIVFSGDTAYSEALIELARDVDLFVCEVMDQGVHDQMAERARAAAAAGDEESIWRHIAETHVTPADVARMATAARANTVVLYHQLPGAREGDLAFPVSAFVEGVRAGFSGSVIVGQDLMVL